jgi:hypothetical protein
MAEGSNFSSIEGVLCFPWSPFQRQAIWEGRFLISLWDIPVVREMYMHLISVHHVLLETLDVL